MSSKQLQILIVIDVEGTTMEDELTALLPDKRDSRVILKLTAFGAARVERRGHDAQPIDWASIGPAIEGVAKRVREEAADHVLHLFVGGQGPLPIFTHLGYALSKFTGAQSVIGRRPGGPWEVFALTSPPPGTELLNARALREDASHATGLVAVYVDVAERPATIAAVRAFVEAQGERLADVVELRPKNAIIVDADNVPVVSDELVAKLARLPSLYPHANGLALFVAGPTVLAFAVGRAINPSIASALWLSNFSSGAYDLVYSLPFVDDATPELPSDANAIGARQEVGETLVAAIAELKVEIVEEDLAVPLLSEERAPFLAHLQALEPESAVTDEFSLSIASGRYALGEGLLEALRNGERDTQQRFAKLLMLHELFHEHQGVRSTNYFDVGRAGVVLEAVDFTADMFALRVLVNSSSRTAKGAVARDLICHWIDAILYGIQAFDLLDGPRIQHLADRRLRRYLTWNLQRARAETVDTADDVAMLLASTLTAELAPVSARIDRRFDREVLNATSDTEFFASIDGRLIRHAKRPGFNPGELVEAVRGFNTAAIQKAMRFVIEEDKRKLIPWRK